LALQEIMPRANRYLVPGHIYHVTHRCHNREFGLRFQRDRNAYRHWLYEGLQRFEVSVLGFVITRNHTHLLLRSATAEAIAQLMHLVEGAVAQQYNRRKGCGGAFWGDRYHCTMVDSGQYLWNCLRYIDLNMVRAGAVHDPGAWKWGGYADLLGGRERYRIIDREVLLESVGYGGFDRWLRDHVDSVRAGLADGRNRRDEKWTESLAVGSREYVERLAPAFLHRRELQINPDECDTKTWIVRERPAPYA
jgi:putative transposase